MLNDFFKDIILDFEVQCWRETNVFCLKANRINTGKINWFDNAFHLDARTLLILSNIVRFKAGIGRPSRFAERNENKSKADYSNGHAYQSRFTHSAGPSSHAALRGKIIFSAPMWAASLLCLLLTVYARKATDDTFELALFVSSVGIIVSVLLGYDAVVAFSDIRFIP